MDRGCSAHPVFPCALFLSRAGRNCKPRTKPCRENAEVCLIVVGEGGPYDGSQCFACAPGLLRLTAAPGVLGPGVRRDDGKRRNRPSRPPPSTFRPAPTYNPGKRNTMIHVCSLAALPETVKATGASHVLTVMARVDQVQRPDSVLEANHLRVQVDDIVEPIDGFVAPSDIHIERVLNFVRGWDRRAPLVVHCYAGISRSTASAFAAACMLNPHRDEMAIARADPRRLPDRGAEPADRQPRRQGAGARGAHAARARRNGAGQHDGRGPAVPHRSRLTRGPRQMSDKLLTPIEIGLTAAIVAIEGNKPLVLIAQSSDGDKLAGLPFGPFDRSRTGPSRSAGAPGWSSRRDCASAMSNSSILSRPRPPHPAGGHRRPMASIGYLALTRAADMPRPHLARLRAVVSLFPVGGLAQGAVG